MKTRTILAVLCVLCVATVSQPLSAQTIGNTRNFLDNGNSGGTVTVRGRMTNIPTDIPEQYRDMRIALRFSAPLNYYDDNIIPLHPDSAGNFEVRAEVVNTTIAQLFTQNVVLEPGRTYEVEIDGYNYTFKGDDTLLNTELAAHPLKGFKWNMDTMDTKTDAEALRAAKAEIARLDSMEAALYAEVPALSLRYRTLRHSCVRAEAAHYLVQRRYLAHNVRQDDGTLWKYIHTLITELPRPYTLFSDISYVLINYLNGLIEPGPRIGLNLSYIRVALDMTEERYALRSDAEAHARIQKINELRTLLDDYEKIRPTATDSALQAHPAYALLMAEFREGQDPVLADIVKGTAVYERQTEQKLAKVVTMTGLPRDLRELALAAELYGLMEQTHVPLTPTLQDIAGKNLQNTYYKKLITTGSDRLARLAASLSSASETDCLMPNAPFEGMTDGEAIWKKIAEPLRGRVIFVDVWGTWCGPCRADLKNHTENLHRALADLPVTYVYLCNRSTDEAWRSCIAEYGLVLPHTLHYNLPPAQQAALEKYLKVEHYPTYILFAPDGSRATAPDQELQIYNPTFLRQQVKVLLGK